MNPSTDQPRRRPSSPSGKLQEGADYYVEDGFYVFTKSFLLKRGFCCQSGCRHCPYGYRAGSAEEDEKGH